MSLVKFPLLAAGASKDRFTSEVSQVTIRPTANKVINTY